MVLHYNNYLAHTKNTLSFIALTTLFSLAFAIQIVSAAPRDIQIRSVNFTTGIIELFNFGTSDEPLDGYRFCSHDEDQVRIYSSTNGLNNTMIEAGTSFFIHLNDDAPGGNDTINASTVGAFAAPLDVGPWSLQLYFPPISFGNGDTIADHVQWSIDGTDDTSADERSDEAETGGVWTDQDLWVATESESISITLDDTTGAELHGPDNYTANTLTVEPPATAVNVPFPLLGLIALGGLLVVIGITTRT